MLVSLRTVVVHVGTLLSTVSALGFGPSGLLVPTLHELERQSLSRMRSSAQDELKMWDVQYPEYNISVPVDHFHNESRYAPHSDEYFDLRYWFDAHRYEEGGPVFVIAAGETDGADRLPFLAKGIVAQLAAKYHGIGVILEHRYYGTSFPVANLSTESLRFLSTDQAMADYAYFATHAVFPGLEHLDLRAPGTPWIAYGGSYAGAFVAFLRKLYPEIYWAAVSTSGVTAAIEDYWQYMEPIRQFAPADCIEATQTLTEIVDSILIDHGENQTLKAQLKTAFGLREVRDDADFAQILSYGTHWFQSRNWDKDVASPAFVHYCLNLTSDRLLYPGTVPLQASVGELISAAGYDSRNKSLVSSMLNWIGFLNASFVAEYTSTYPDEEERALALSTPRSATDRAVAQLSSPRRLADYRWLSWPYQVCTEWGYFITGASVPSDTRPIISRLLDLPYVSQLCPTLFNITTKPELDRINRHGNFAFSYPRVAIVDGLADPWRPATPHADHAPARNSTDDEPFLLIDIPAEHVWDGIRGAVHHWDQNGLSPREMAQGKMPPDEIVAVHGEIVRLVGVWLKQWEATREPSTTTGELLGDQRVLGDA